MTTVPTEPLEGVRVSVAVVTVKVADMMKLVPTVPCETSTCELPDDGTVIVIPVGIAPPAVAVKVVPVPLGQATAVAWTQYA